MISQEQIQDIYRLKQQGISTDTIARLVETSVRTVQRYAKKFRDVESFIEETVVDSSQNNPVIVGEHRVLVIPDIHAPFTKLEYLDFLKKLYQDYKCDTVVFIGDLVDIHTISTHPTSTSSIGTISEYKQALDIVAKYIEAFPNAKYCLGNHCRRIMKQAATVGIPSEFLKSFKDLYNLPDTWEIGDSFIINNVLYTHGTEFAGRNAISTISNSTHHSTVVGHAHSSFGVIYTNSGYDQLFTLEVGCLIDSDAYAFEYGKNNKYRPVLGAGVVISESEAYAIPYIEE